VPKRPKKKEAKRKHTERCEEADQNSSVPDIADEAMKPKH
jgi:hypothetical protein